MTKDVLQSDDGEGGELRGLLIEALGIPPTATSFEVCFAQGQPVRVRCEYVAVSVAEPDEVFDMTNVASSLEG